MTVTVVTVTIMPERPAADSERPGPGRSDKAAAARRVPPYRARPCAGPGHPAPPGRR